MCGGNGPTEQLSHSGFRHSQRTISHLGFGDIRPSQCGILQGTSVAVGSDTRPTCPHRHLSRELFPALHFPGWRVRPAAKQHPLGDPLPASSRLLHCAARRNKCASNRGINSRNLPLVSNPGVLQATRGFCYPSKKLIPKVIVKIRLKCGC